MDEVVDLVNKYDDVPMEARRLVLESVMHIAEKSADKAIIAEREEEEENNAKNIFQDQLGELPE